MKLSPYSLVLPLLAGIAAFSSKARFPDRELTIFCSWALFLTCAYIFIRNIRYRVPAIILVLAVAAVRFAMALLDLPPAVRLVNFAGSFVVIVFAGLAVFLKIPRLLLRQMYWLAALSIVISLLQMNGVVWAQQAGSAVEDKGVTSERVFRQGYEAMDSVGLLQSRPDGFTHANNLTSQLLLMFYAVAFFHYTTKTGRARGSTAGLFLISFAGALNGGKIVVLAIIVIYAFSFLVLPRVNKIRMMCAAGILGCAHLLYYLLFPGLFILNFNWDLFVYNASGRIINLGVAAKTDKLEPLAAYIRSLGSDRYIGADYMASENYKVLDGADAYSGIAKLAPYLPVLLVAGLGAAFLWKRHAWRLRGFQIDNLASGSAIVAVTLFASIFGGPFYQTVWFTFFLSLALAPILRRFNPRFIASVSQHPE